MKLVLIRHGESEWNRLNLFTGWTDVDLSEKGHMEAIAAGKQLKREGFEFDICYTSYLKRAIHTLNHILSEMELEWLPVIKDWRLNERHYGALQGLNKAETAEKYGEEQVKIWRRSYNIRPPELSTEDERNPQNQLPYRQVSKSSLPSCESLKDTVARVIPYFEEIIKNELQQGKQVIIAAHGNSLRALVKYFDALSEKEIMDVNIPTGIPLIYEFDDRFQVFNKYYLGNQDEIQAKIQTVENQGKTNQE